VNAVTGEMIDLREELWLVRRQLDRLSTDRMFHFLYEGEETSYRMLAEREIELMWALARSEPSTDATDGSEVGRGG
jgi:hypothetical protein